MLLQCVIVSDGVQRCGPAQWQPTMCPSGGSCHSAVINFPFSENFSALVCLYESWRGLPPMSSRCSKDDLKSTYQSLIGSDFMSKDLELVKSYLE